MKNDFYAIACDDLRYLQATLHLPFYNQIAIQSQQVAEKMIKSVAERSCIGIEKEQTKRFRIRYGLDYVDFDRVGVLEEDIKNDFETGPG